MGGTLSASAMAGMLKGCTPSREVNWVPGFLNKDQALAIADMANIIIPRTDTPGALDVAVDEFIDLMLKDNFEDEDKTRFTNGLMALNQYCEESFGSSFALCNAENKMATVKKLDSESATWSGEGKPPFFRTVKELVLLGYFTSEEGLKRNLSYRPVPGSQEGCVPLKDGEKSEVGNHV